MNGQGAFLVAGFGDDLPQGTFHGDDIPPGTFHGDDIPPGTFH
jgi:hypothetical protein